jgi:hypothetical protein
MVVVSRSSLVTNLEVSNTNFLKHVLIATWISSSFLQARHFWRGCSSSCMLGDVQVAFGILSGCFVQRLSYLFCMFMLLLNFWHQLASFNSICMQVFERLLGPWFLKCLVAPLVCQKVSLPIFNGGIGLIFTETIISIAYLGSWMLVVLVIASKFLLDSRPFYYWRLLGWIIQVFSPFNHTWSCFENFFH